MRMRRVAGDKDPSRLVSLGHRNPQIPEADMVECASERKAGGLLQQGPEVVVVAGRVGRHRRMKEPAFADVDAAEKLPIAVEIGMDDPIGRARWKTLEAFVKLTRTKQRQDHQLVEISAAAGDAGLLADQGTRAVAADGVIGLQSFTPG